MSVVIGIDIGGSTTKICGFRREGSKDASLISPFLIRATDPVTSIYGAFGKFIDENHLALSDVERVMMTGVGATDIRRPLYDLPCEHIPEFRCTGRGGLYISGLSDAIVVSLGTGTAIIHAKVGEEPEYLGGTGVGGGTLIGLSRRMLGVDTLEHIVALAEEGDLSHVDLRIGDLSNREQDNHLPPELTMSNFGKLSDLASNGDVALGILNMIFETVGMLSLFAAKKHNLTDVVVTGNLAAVPYAKTALDNFGRIFHLNMLLCDLSPYATVIGTALCGLSDR